MTQAVPMVEIWRGEMLESMHMGHAVVYDLSGGIVEAWGDPDLMIYPRSSCKMIQALPLLRSGAADAYGLTSEHLALACASHNGAAIHTDRVKRWMDQLGLTDDAFRCGPQEPGDVETRDALIRAGRPLCRHHNNCSGKHAGFLTLTKHIKAGPGYVDPSHPVQHAVRDAYEEATGLSSPGFGIDGCSAPNFITSLTGLARAMASMAAANDGPERRLTAAMMAHPELVAGEGRACTELMRATTGKAAVKTGAEAVFVAILPAQKLGIALKIVDGATRAAEAAITGLLVKYKVLGADHPTALKWAHGPIRNWDGLETGHMRFSAGFL